MILNAEIGDYALSQADGDAYLTFNNGELLNSIVLMDAVADDAVIADPDSLIAGLGFDPFMEPAMAPTHLEALGASDIA